MNRDLQQSSVKPVFICSECFGFYDLGTNACPRDGSLQRRSLLPGDLLVGRYQYLGCLGQGGMGFVYKARHEVLDRVVAIKVLKSKNLAIDERKRFELEGKAISRLKHPGIICVHEFGTSENGHPFMAIDYIGGTTLSKLLEQKGYLAVSDALEITISILSAVQHAHDNGVVHRDLKPSNIMLSETVAGKFSVMVLDFGIAKVHTFEGNDPTLELTRTGAVFGSPLSMSPEQAKGQRADNRSDIYSIGCILYETLTGSPPFRGETALETMVKHITDQPTPLHEASFGRNFPSLIEETVFKALAKNPEERFASADEFALKLKQCLGGTLSSKESAAKAPDSADRLKDVARRALLPIVLILSLAAMAFGAWSYLKEPSQNLSESGREVNNDISRIRTELASQDKTAQHRSKSDEGSNTESAEDQGPVTSSDTTKVGPDVVAHSMINFANGKDGSLELSHTALSEKELAYLASKKRIRILSLKSCDTNDKLFEYLADMPLQKITLDFMNISDAGLKKLHDLPSLSELQMWHANGENGHERVLGADGLESLAQLHHLRRLGFFASALRNYDLRFLPHLKMLETLDLSNNNLNDQGIDWVEQIPILSDLTLSHNNVSVARIARMKNISLLRSLAISGNYRFDRYALEALASNAKSLQSLDLSYTAVTFQDLEPLFALKGLRDLNLTSCKKLSETDIKNVVAELPNCDVTSDFDDKLLHH